MATHFMPEPTLVLKTDDEVRAALDNPEYMTWQYPRGWHVRAEPIVEVIEQIVAEGKYPYNADVQRRVEARLNIPRQNDDASPLSRLVYNAQGFRRTDEHIREGYAPLTQEMLDTAGEGGQIMMKGSTMLGMPATAVYNVRNVDGKLYMMEPRKRKYAVRLDGQPAKIIKHGKTVAKAG